MYKQFEKELTNVLKGNLDRDNTEIEIRIGRKKDKFQPNFTQKELKELFIALDTDPDFWEEISSIEYAEKRAKQYRFRYNLKGEIIESIKKKRKIKRDIKQKKLDIRISTAYEEEVEPKFKKIKKLTHVKKRWLYRREFFFLHITKYNGNYQIEIEVDREKAKDYTLPYIVNALIEYTNFVITHING